MKNAIFLAVALALGTGAVLPAEAATQGNVRAVRATAQADMVLTGSIDISAAGRVDAYRLDHAEKVPGYVQDYLRPIIAAWRFDPTITAGRPVAVTAPLSLRLTGRPLADGGWEMTLADAGFRSYDKDDLTELASLEMRPPSYPDEISKAGGTGEVMVLLQVDRNGAVTDAIAERVDLTVVARERVMQQFRDGLAKASLQAARKWTFRVPTEGPHQDAEGWTARVPVSFAIEGLGVRREARYGQWRAYIPGPRQRAPWHEGEDDTMQGGMLPDQGVFLAGVQKGPKLLTPVGG